jgi:hypothetical protein
MKRALLLLVFAGAATIGSGFAVQAGWQARPTAAAEVIFKEMDRLVASGKATNVAYVGRLFGKDLTPSVSTTTEKDGYISKVSAYDSVDDGNDLTLIHVTKHKTLGSGARGQTMSVVGLNEVGRRTCISSAQVNAFGEHLRMVYAFLKVGPGAPPAGESLQWTFNGDGSCVQELFLVDVEDL